MSGKQISHESSVLFLVLLLSLLILFRMVPMVHAQDYTINAGESQSTQLADCISSSGPGNGAYTQVSAAGDAASWVDPNSFDFGYMAYGSGCEHQDYTISVPADTPSGTYTLTWNYNCQDDSGGECDSSTASYTIQVNGVQNTTTEETTTINYTTTIIETTTTTIDYIVIPPTTTIGTYSCPEGQVAGGLPGSPQCYPSGMQVAEQGSASIVDLTGSPTSAVVDGTSVVTQADQYVNVSYQGIPDYSYTIDPGTMATDYGATYVSFNNGSSGFTTDATSTLYDTVDQIGAGLGLHIYSEATLHTMLEVMSEEVGLGALSVPVGTPITMMMVYDGVIKDYNKVLGSLPGIAVCNGSFSMSACPASIGTDPVYTMSVGDNGTTLAVTNGSVLVSSLSATGKTPKYITLNAGQELFIPDNTTQANAQNLASSVKTFLQGPTTTIPKSTTTISQNNNGGSAAAAYVIIFIIIIILAALVLRGKGKTAKVEERKVVKQTTSAPANEGNDDIKVLKQRYANGEITRKQFEQMKKDLEG